MHTVEEKVQVNGQELEIIKITILELSELIFKNLIKFMEIEGIKEELKPRVYMSNVLQNFLSNILVQEAEGDVNKIKSNFVDFTAQLMSFFRDVLPVIENNLKDKKEMH